ncbi:hypothetical protein [Shewanella algicola]|uniref:hypothetical protein n=1 Tax=Shewanella algicola TaxID=640633 RepID=UPI002494BD7E|nr:hypothetical protein [Shewanella algicola]
MNIKEVSTSSLMESFMQSTIEDEKNITSRLALVVHSNHSGSTSCITRHPIENWRLGLGEVISVSDVVNELSKIDDLSEANDNDWLESYTDENILVKNNKTLVWHTPRQSRKLYLSIDSVTVTVPPLLYIYKTPNRSGAPSLQVFALAANKRPKLTAKLYHAPLMNIYSDGRLCLGNIKLPTKVTSQTIEQVEKEFFYSRFTHPNHSHLTRKQVNIEAFYKMKEKTGKKILTSELMPTGKHLVDVIG